jgi:hypothetical protein
MVTKLQTNYNREYKSHYPYGPTGRILLLVYYEYDITFLCKMSLPMVTTSDRLSHSERLKFECGSLTFIVPKFLK